MESGYTPQRYFAWKSAISTLTLVFAALAVIVVTNYEPLLAFDTATVHFIASQRTPLLNSVFTSITHMGSLTTAGLTTLASFLLIKHRRYWAYIAGYLVTITSTIVSGYILKILIDRARPDATISLITETSNSFPSGHAAIAVALYGFLAYLLYLAYPNKRTPILTGLVGIISLLGFSRIYLGAHFPSDVLAGYALGGIWLILGIKVVQKCKDQFVSSTP